jgi:hypothetical protein
LVLLGQEQSVFLVLGGFLPWRPFAETFSPQGENRYRADRRQKNQREKWQKELPSGTGSGVGFSASLIFQGFCDIGFRDI